MLWSQQINSRLACPMEIPATLFCFVPFVEAHFSFEEKEQNTFNIMAHLIMFIVYFKLSIYE